MPGMDMAEYEAAKQRIGLELFEQALVFAKKDNEINEQMSRILTAAANYVEKNPDAFNGNGDFRKALNEAAAGEIRGGDIRGGDMQDVIDLIRAITGTLKDEKDFFFSIIRLIFCGC